MTLDARRAAAWAVVRAMRTGEATAARVAQRHLAHDIEYLSARDRFSGCDAVAERLTGQWTYTPVLAIGAWDVLVDDAGDVVAVADFTGLGAAPRDFRLRFAFDDSGDIVRIEETSAPAQPPAPAGGMSPWIRRCIDRALADAKPVALSYVGNDGAPSLSLRGSLQTIDATRLGLWLRKPCGGLADAIAGGQAITFLYRDSATRTTLVGRASGTIVNDPGSRDAVYEMTPEVEQRHDPGRSGAAAILSLIDLKGTSPHGPVLVVPTRPG